MPTRIEKRAPHLIRWFRKIAKKNQKPYRWYEVETN